MRTVLDTFFPPWPCYSEQEADAVKQVLLSNKVNYWTGEEGRLFEAEFARWCGTDHAVAVANGTLALELALVALGVGPGDEVITTPRTFIASASSIVMRGAAPVFADVDPESQNLTAESIRANISPKTKAIIVVHLAGWPCDMDPIMAIAESRGIKVIEDCAQAHGAAYKGRPVGSMGHVGAFSFCQDKIMTTGGEGGMLVTSDRTLWERAWAFKDHGKSFDAVFNRKHLPGFRWLHESFGTNWRLTEMQSALGRIQLQRLPDMVSARRRNARHLLERFAGIPGLRITVPDKRFFHSYYKFYVFVRPEELKPDWSRDRIMQELNAGGIPCFSGSCSELYREKAFAQLETPVQSPVPTAGQLGKTSLMFLVHPGLTEQHMEATCDAVSRIFRNATG